MKRKNLDYPKLRRSSRRTKINENLYGSTFIYIKFFLIWAIVLLADFILEFRFEYLWPFWLLIRSVYDSFKYQGLAFSVFFICIALTSDMICLLTIPAHWLFFAASTYVWVQFIWHTERGICLPTISLWLLFVYIEASVRLRELKNVPFHLDLCRPFAAHCIGYPMVTLGFGFKSYITYRLRQKKQKDIAKENNFFHELLKKALPDDFENNTDEIDVRSYSEKSKNINQNNYKSNHVTFTSFEKGDFAANGHLNSHVQPTSQYNLQIPTSRSNLSNTHPKNVNSLANGHYKPSINQQFNHKNQLLQNYDTGAIVKANELTNNGQHHLIADHHYEENDHVNGTYTPGPGGHIIYSISKAVCFLVSIISFNFNSAPSSNSTTLLSTSIMRPESYNTMDVENKDINSSRQHQPVPLANHTGMASSYSHLKQTADDYNQRNSRSLASSSSLSSHDNEDEDAQDRIIASQVGITSKNIHRRSSLGINHALSRDLKSAVSESKHLSSYQVSANKNSGDMYNSLPSSKLQCTSLATDRTTKQPVHGQPRSASPNKDILSDGDQEDRNSSIVVVDREEDSEMLYMEVKQQPNRDNNFKTSSSATQVGKLPRSNTVTTAASASVSHSGTLKNLAVTLSTHLCNMVKSSTTTLHTNPPYPSTTTTTTTYVTSTAITTKFSLATPIDASSASAAVRQLSALSAPTKYALTQAYVNSLASPSTTTALNDDTTLKDRVINNLTSSINDDGSYYEGTATIPTSNFFSTLTKLEDSNLSPDDISILKLDDKRLASAFEDKDNSITTYTDIYKMEIDVKKLKNDLQASRLCEHELRNQITSLQNTEKCAKNETALLKIENEALMAKIANLQSNKLTDKQQLSVIEKKLLDEQKLRAKLENQLLEKRLTSNSSSTSVLSKYHHGKDDYGRNECNEACKIRKRDLENDIRQLCKDAKVREEQLWSLEKELQSLRQLKGQKAETEMLVTALSALKNKNAHLETSLNAETKLKLDLFSALSEAKRNLEINQTLLIKRERESNELRGRVTELLGLSTALSTCGSMSNYNNFCNNTVNKQRPNLSVTPSSTLFSSFIGSSGINGSEGHSPPAILSGSATNFQPGGASSNLFLSGNRNLGAATSPPNPSNILFAGSNHMLSAGGPLQALSPGGAGGILTTMCNITSSTLASASGGPNNIISNNNFNANLTNLITQGVISHSNAANLSPKSLLNLSSMLNTLNTSSSVVGLSTVSAGQLLDNNNNPHNNFNGVGTNALNDLVDCLTSGNANPSHISPLSSPRALLADASLLTTNGVYNASKNPQSSSSKSNSPSMAGKSSP